MIRPESLRRVTALTACALVLLAILGQLNHTLAPHGLSVATPGLLTAFAALRLDWRTGLTSTLLAGLLLDAHGGAPFGRSALLLSLGFCLLHRAAPRLPREQTLVGVVAAIFLNLGFFATDVLSEIGSLPRPGSAALRLLADLTLSQIFTAIIGPWFLALQARALQIAGHPTSDHPASSFN